MHTSHFSDAVVHEHSYANLLLQKTKTEFTLVSEKREISLDAFHFLEIDSQKKKAVFYVGGGAQYIQQNNVYLFLFKLTNVDVSHTFDCQFTSNETSAVEQSFYKV